MGRDRRKVPFRGELRTYDEIAEITGLHATTVKARVSKRVSLEIPSRTERESWRFRGELRTIREIAALTGRCYDAVRLRIQRGVALDASDAEVRAAKPQSADVNVTVDALRIDEDRQMQFIENYFYNGEPLTSVHEIVAMFGCNVEEAVELREQLRGEIFGKHATLEFIGDVFGVVRERIRQIQDEALRKLRTRPTSRRVLLEMREDASERERTRGHHPLHEASTQKAG
jgi:hypothetical protein